MFYRFLSDVALFQGQIFKIFLPVSGGMARKKLDLKHFIAS